MFICPRALCPRAQANDRLMAIPIFSEGVADDRLRSFEEYRLVLKENERERKVLETERLRQIEKRQRGEYRVCYQCGAGLTLAATTVCGIY